MADHPDRQPGGWPSTTAMQFLTRAQGRVAAMVAIVLLATGYAWLGKQYWHPVRSSLTFPLCCFDQISCFFLNRTT
jgi:hypothetical protein